MIAAPLPSLRRLCNAQRGHAHRFWPVKEQPGLSICLVCGCDEWLPRLNWRDGTRVFGIRPIARATPRTTGALP